MLIKSLKAIVGASLLTVAASAGAADLMITPMGVNGGTQIKFEFVNDESNVTALEFDLKIAGAKMEQSQIAGCAKGIFTNHSGACSVKNDVLTVIVFSPENAVLPTFELGMISLDVAPHKLGEMTARGLVMANAKGMQVSGGAIILDKSHLRNVVSEEQLKRFSAK